MKSAVFGWIMFCCVLPQGSECMNIHRRQPSKIKKELKSKKIIYKTEFQEKGSATARPKIENNDTEIILIGRVAHSKSLKQKSSKNFSIELDGAAKTISLPATRKDVLVKNPQNVHFAKRVVLGSQFRNLLKKLYQNHSKDVQAIKRKLTSEQLQLLESKEEGEDDKANIYNIEGKSEASKNKTVVELRAAILRLLNKVAKKARAAHDAEQRYEKDESSGHHFKKKKFGQTLKAEIEESYDHSRSPSAIAKGEDLSAKRANYLDLLNFIARMKSTDIGKDVDLYDTDKMRSSDKMENDGMNNMLNSRDSMTQMPYTGNMQQEKEEMGVLPGEGMQMQEFNLAQQRKLLEDQLENRIAQLQLKARLPVPQQEFPQMQNFQNDDMANFMQRLQNAIATPSLGPMPLSFREPAMFQKPSFFPRVNPYLPFARPFPATGTGLPFYRPMNPRPPYPMDDEEEDHNEDEDDNSDYDNDDQDEPLPHHSDREHEENDNDDDDEGEQRYSDNDER
ncbi:uncharacterized protein LOC111328358 [Stylophora pistillata]|uniref:Uncharacterized protein n=1 Tax=Stylophora pistillata TaxID=50429 RepID=A0A2B4S885_STYPI|nr:uncharacterized protein LOC111328358 [Stylophora pistillata]PFX26874.1 hypothetical protein AWC38_SpisGene8434 [Stylophora pistillata]